MRLDKFLKVSRVIKRRTIAAEACEKGRVCINGRTAKPGAQLKIGDVVEVSFAGARLTFRVLSLNEKAGKAEADSMYEIIGESN